MKKSFSIFIFIVLFSSFSVFAQSETEKGVELYRKEDFDGAIAVLTKVVAADEQDRKALIYLGTSFAKKGNDKEARRAFKKAQAISVSKDLLSEMNDGLVVKAKPRATYTDLARQNGIQGTVKFAVEFGADGKIKYVFIINSLPYGLTETSLNALKKIEVEPAQKNGKPVSVVSLFEYSFAIY